MSLKRPLYAILTLFLLSACARTTMVSGRITNIRTGNPVVGMPVTLYVYNGHEPRDSAIPKKVGEASTQTDSNGEYALEYSGAGIDEADLELDRGLLCSAFFETYADERVKANASREVNVQIDSIDGRMEIVLQNQSGQHETIYFRVDCDATGDKGVYCCNRNFENPVPAGQSKSLTLPVSADRYVPVYWGTTKFSNWNAPHVDSIYCPKGVTTTFVLSF